MDPKKTKKSNLEAKKALFLELGFLIALGLVLLAFEWTSQPKTIQGFQQQNNSGVVQESVPVTTHPRQKEPPPPPPPPSQTEVINIVKNDVPVIDELNLEETGADEDTQIALGDFEDEDKESEEDPPIFMKVEDMPTFKNGDVDAFRNYVQRNVHYPTAAAENGIEGTVYITFVIDTDGGISNAKVIRGVDPSLDGEAMRVIRNAPAWEPGKQRGKPVHVQFTIPIHFRLQ